MTKHFKNKNNLSSKFYTVILYSLCIFILIACRHKTSNLDKNSFPLKGEIKMDTTTGRSDVMYYLNKYYDAESLGISGYFTSEDLSYHISSLWIYKIKGKSIGVALSDQITELGNNRYILLFQRINNKWILSDSVRTDYSLLMGISFIDLNGDDIKDIKLSGGSGAAMDGNNDENIVFLFYPNEKIFRHNPCYDLWNIKYDKEDKFIRSSYIGKYYSYKDLYNISADSLIKYQTVEFTYKIDSNGNLNDAFESATLLYYNNVNGEMILKKRIKGKFNDLNSFYNKSLWISKDDDINYNYSSPADF